MTPQAYLQLRQQLETEEARRPFAYDDATGQTLRPGDTLRGQLTIGVGWNLSARGLPADVIDLLLDRAIEDTLVQLRQALPWFATLDDVRQVALMDLAFNLGVPTLLTFQQTLAHVQQGEYAAAADRLAHTLWARQVDDGVGGRFGRADRVCGQIRTGATG